MLNDVIILVQLFNFSFHNYHKNENTKIRVFPYCFPRKGALTDARDGDGGGQQIPKYPNISPRIIKDHKTIEITKRFFLFVSPGREL